MGDRKFEFIDGLELEEESNTESKDIEYGTLVLKLVGEENPIVFDLNTKNDKQKMFLMEFFLTTGGEFLKEIKEKNEKD